MNIQQTSQLQPHTKLHTPNRGKLAQNSPQPAALSIIFVGFLKRFLKMLKFLKWFFMLK